MEKLTKICTKCNCEKELTEFSFRKDTNYYRKECKKCRCEHSKNFRKLNLDKCRAQENDYNSKNREFRKEKSREYRLNNPDKISKQRKEYRINNKEKIIEIRKNNYIKNKQSILLKNSKYINSDKGKLVKRNICNKRRTITKSGDVTTEQLKNLYENSKKCYWCEKDLINGDIHLDHFYPISLGGKHTITNLVLTCSKCNLKKGAKNPYDFATEIKKVICQ